nr:ABC transporter permease [Bacteroidota bacterium]
MLKHFIHTTWRILYRSKAFSLINLSGLVIGMASSILILLYIKYELNYDRFNDNYDQIYRVNMDFLENGELKHQFASSNSGMVPIYRQIYPEVVNGCRLYRYEGVITAGGKRFRENVCYADAPLFEVFSFKMVDGDYKELDKPFIVFISEKMARKYFGNDNPMGRVINFNGESDVKVAGIFSEVPNQSHIHFDFLISWATLERVAGNEFAENWDFVDTHTYLQLDDQADIPALEHKMTEYSHKKVKEFIGEEEPRSNVRLQALKDIHLRSHYLSEFERNGNAQNVYFLTILALFILAMAGINFMNLSTARASYRATEIGIRKVNGASLGNLFRQFLGEALLIAFIAHLIAVAIVELSLPAFNNLSGKNLFIDCADPWFYISIVAIVLFCTLLAGAYPAFYLSHVKSANILKGDQLFYGRKGLLRKLLVMFQFVIAIGLVAGSLAVYRQINFMIGSDTGFNMENMLIVRAPSVMVLNEAFEEKDFLGNLNVFKLEAEKIPGIKTISASSSIPGSENATGNVAWSTDMQTEIFCHIDGVDNNFFPVYGIKMVAGENFGPSPKQDMTNAIVNKEFARLFGFPDPRDAINQKFSMFMDEFTIIGVSDDIHHFSLQNPVTPLIYLSLPLDLQFHRYYTIKLDSGLDEEMIDKIRQIYEKLFQGNAFEYFDLATEYNRQYHEEVNFSTVILLFTGLSLIIVCLGLLGLSIFNAQSKVREIGIRKAFGAGTREISILLTSGTIKLLLGSAIISLPVTWFVVNAWLDHYAYAISIGWWFWVWPVLYVLAISIFVISWQVIKSAIENPVNALKYE